MRAMACDVTVHVSQAGASEAVDTAVAGALRVFPAVQRACTRFDPQSPLMRANALADQWHAVPQVLFDTVQEAHRAYLRTAEQPRSSEIAVGDLRLDLLTKVAWRAGQRIELAPREWALLELFMRHPHQVLSRAQILSSVWDQTFETGSNVVDVYVGYLRKKLNKPALEPLLVTVRGAGYRFATDATGRSGQPERSADARN